MKHQRFYEWCETPQGPWQPVSAEELLFVLIPEGKVFAYRLIIINLEQAETPE